MMEIYTAGLIAYETAFRFYKEQKMAFEEHFPRFFLKEFVNLPSETAENTAFLDKLCIEKNTKKLYSKKNFFFDGAVYAREIKDGGLFAALWAACEDLSEIRLEQGKPHIIGCSIDLDAIPIDQHVTELLEFVKESPYEAGSEGSWLLICEKETRPDGAVRIGEVTARKDRVVVSGENVRYLSPPQRQAQEIADRQQGNHRTKAKE